MRGAEVLALGSEMGEMRLALRRMGDDTVAKRDYDWVSDTLVTSAYEEVMKRLKRMDAVDGSTTLLRARVPGVISS